MISNDCRCLIESNSVKLNVGCRNRIRGFVPKKTVIAQILCNCTYTQILSSSSTSGRSSEIRTNAIRFINNRTKLNLDDSSTQSRLNCALVLRRKHACCRAWLWARLRTVRVFYKGGPAHGARRGGKKCRDGRRQEDDEGTSCLHGTRWLSYLLRGKGGKSLEPRAVVSLVYPTGDGFGIARRRFGAPA